MPASSMLSVSPLLTRGLLHFTATSDVKLMAKDDELLLSWHLGAWLSKDTDLGKTWDEPEERLSDFSFLNCLVS